MVGTRGTVAVVAAAVVGLREHAARDSVPLATSNHNFGSASVSRTFPKAVSRCRRTLFVPWDWTKRKRPHSDRRDFLFLAFPSSSRSSSALPAAKPTPPSTTTPLVVQARHAPHAQRPGPLPARSRRLSSSLPHPRRASVRCDSRRLGGTFPLALVWAEKHSRLRDGAASWHPLITDYFPVPPSYRPSPLRTAFCRRRRAKTSANSGRTLSTLAC
jgi:hypothetical protein